MTLELGNYEDAFDDFTEPVSGNDIDRVNDAIAQLRDVEESGEETGT